LIPAGPLLNRRLVAMGVSSVLLSLLFFSYFLYVYLNWRNVISDFNYIVRYSPAFLKRYENLILANAFLREKILNGNTHTGLDFRNTLDQ
jgi:hypothetical protein